jgi:hypothetical protein
MGASSNLGGEKVTTVYKVKVVGEPGYRLVTRNEKRAYEYAKILRLEGQSVEVHTNDPAIENLKKLFRKQIR